MLFMYRSYNMQYAKEGNQTTTETRKCYTIVIISMVIPLIIGALRSVIKRLVDS